MEVLRDKNYGSGTRKPEVVYVNRTCVCKSGVVPEMEFGMDPEERSLDPKGVTVDNTG